MRSLTHLKSYESTNQCKHNLLFKICPRYSAFLEYSLLPHFAIQLMNIFEDSFYSALPQFNLLTAQLSTRFPSHQIPFYCLTLPFSVLQIIFVFLIVFIPILFCTKSFITETLSKN